MNADLWFQAVNLVHYLFLLYCASVLLDIWDWENIIGKDLKHHILFYFLLLLLVVVVVVFIMCCGMWEIISSPWLYYCFTVLYKKILKCIPCIHGWLK